MSNADVVRQYLDAFTGGDIDAAAALVTEDFSFRGPILQSDGRAAFVEGARMAAAMAAGYEMLHQVQNDDQVVSVYELEVGAPAKPGKIVMAEWSTVRDGRLASTRLLFDTAAFGALMPES